MAIWPKVKHSKPISQHCPRFRVRAVFYTERKIAAKHYCLAAIVYCTFDLFVKHSFLSAVKDRRSNTRQGHRHQSDPQSEMAVVAGLRRGRGAVIV